MHAIASADPVIPSTLNPEMPPAIDALILRMLAKHAVSRPTSAEIDHQLSELATGGALAYSSHSLQTQGHQSQQSVVTGNSRRYAMRIARLFEAVDISCALPGKPG